MLSGYNTNVRHRGVLFHVQTEDSGRANPHVVSHLYHGGVILASEKQEYRERLESADLSSYVRSMMEAQHDGLVERLRSGALDRGIEERLGPVFGDDSQTRPPEAGSDAPPAGEPAASRARRFGDGLISDRPLDEVVLEYLVENARRRKRPGR